MRIYPTLVSNTTDEISYSIKHIDKQKIILYYQLITAKLTFAFVVVKNIDLSKNVVFISVLPSHAQVICTDSVIFHF